MSPKLADPAVRRSLIDAAAQVLAADGPRALTTRRLAREVGTSTMAVYTHFGSMHEIHRAVRRDGFARLLAVLEGPGYSNDPVADLAAVGVVYFDYGLSNPALYKVMFIDQPPDDDHDPGAAVFDLHVKTVQRCIQAGRFHEAEPEMSLRWAAEVWTMRHGMVTLALPGLLPVNQIKFLLADMTYRLCIGYGDDPAASERSIEQG